VPGRRRTPPRHHRHAPRRHHAVSAPHRARHWHEAPPRAARRTPGSPPRPQGAGLCRFLPPGHLGQGIGWDPRGHVRRPERPGPSPVGLVCSRRLVPASPSIGAAIPRPCGEHTRHRQRLDRAGPAVGPGRLFHAPTPGGCREGAMLPASREGSGCACGRAGHPGDAPARGARHGVSPCVCARPGAERARGPAPAPWMGHPLSLLVHTVLVAHGRRGLPLTRAWRSLDHADALRPLWAAAGRRAQRHCAGAEHAQTRLGPRRSRGERTSRRVWCRHVGAPAYGKADRTRCQVPTALSYTKAEKTGKIRSQE
jgi:hypothetical protein